MTVFGEFDIPLPWDVLHAATIKCLPGYLPGYVDFTFELLSPGYSVFRLSQSELGALGNITLSKAGDMLTTLHPEPVFTTIRRARDNLIIGHFSKVIWAYLNRLVHEISIWRANGSEPPPYILEWAGIARDSAVLKMICAKSRRDWELAGTFFPYPDDPPSPGVVFERQFTGSPADIEKRLEYFNREEQTQVHGPFVRVWVADKQANELETRFTLMGMARDELVEGKFGNYLIGEVIVLTHGNWVKGEAYDARASDCFEKLGKWLVDGELPLAEDQPMRDATLELESRRLPMNEIDKWQAEVTKYLQQSWRVELKQFASGTWPGSLDAFRGALMAFRLQAKDDEFGKHSFRFWILPNQAHPISGETCWMIGMSGCNRKSLYTVKNEEGYLEAEGGEPYAEIRVREIARGYRVDLLVLSDVHEEAIAEYLEKLYQALQRDGLRTTYSKNGLQPKQVTQQILPALDSTEVVDGKGGRPGLSGEELVYRLAKAQEAEEIRARDPRKTWKEIAREIKWRHGSDKAGVKLLEDARKRLEEHELLGPEWRFQQVEEFRRKEKKET
jgi:hypothetical protein